MNDRRLRYSTFRVLLAAAVVLSLLVFAQAKPVLAGALTDFSHDPSETPAGATATHTISFTTANALPAAGQIRITFPDGFNLSGVTTDEVTVTGPNGTFTVSRDDQTLIIARNGDGTQFAPGEITVKIDKVVNTTTSGTYHVTVGTYFYGWIDGPNDSVTFNVVPSANFSPNKGPCGTSVTVTGCGWKASELILRAWVDSQPAVHTLSVNSAGNLSGTITIPWGLTTGMKNVTIEGSMSDDQTFTEAFEVTEATADLEPATGPAGTVTTVSGTGWAPSDTITAVTVGGSSATHTLTVDDTGALSGTITIPSGLSTGAKTVLITGTKSGTQQFTSAFTVTALPTPTFNPSQGPVGTVTTVSGTGWAPSDTITAVTVGGKSATHTLTVNDTGALSGKITIPSGLTTGAKNVVITGQYSGARTFTSAFTVTEPPTATFTPSSTSSLPQVVNVSGSGWVPSDTITAVTVGGEFATAVSLTVDAAGALSGTITVPNTVKLGTHDVVITGQKTGEQTFTGAFKVLAEIKLCQGWNLISLPLIPNNTAIATVLSGISDKVESVWYYVTSTGSWKTWSPGIGGNLTTIEDGKAYWIKMTDAATLTVEGRMAPVPPTPLPTYSLSAGWNMLGYKSTIERETVKTGTPLGYLNNIAGKYSYLVTYDCHQASPWQEIELDRGTMKPGFGYWIYMTQAGSIPAPAE